MRYLHLLIFVAALSLTGCTLLTHLFTPPTNGQQTADSPAVEVGKKFLPLAGPWGEVGLLALMTIQNGFLARKKLAEMSVKKEKALAKTVAEAVKNGG